MNSKLIFSWTVHYSNLQVTSLGRSGQFHTICIWYLCNENSASNMTEKNGCVLSKGYLGHKRAKGQGLDPQTPPLSMCLLKGFNSEKSVCFVFKSSFLHHSLLFFPRFLTALWTKQFVKIPLTIGAFPKIKNSCENIHYSIIMCTWFAIDRN